VEHPEIIKGTSSLFADGSSAAMWFSGLVTEEWVNTKGISRSEYEVKGELLLNHQVDVMRLALLNFHRSFLWVGILEEMPRSLALFRHQTGLKLKSGSDHLKSNSNSHPPPTKAERAVIEAANPMDMALYEYIRTVQLGRMTALEEAISKNRTVPWCKSSTDWMAFSFPFTFNGSQIWPPPEATSGNTGGSVVERFFGLSGVHPNITMPATT